MSDFVLDASLALQWFLEDEAELVLTKARRVAEELQANALADLNEKTREQLGFVLDNIRWTLSRRVHDVQALRPPANGNAAENPRSKVSLPPDSALGRSQAAGQETAR